MKDDNFIEKRFSADNDHFTKIGLTDRLTRKTLEFKKPGKQVFLATARQANLQNRTSPPASQSFAKSLAFANTRLTTILLISIFLVTTELYGQIQQPKTPTFEQNQQVQPNKSYTPAPNQYGQPNNPNSSHKVPNANDIMEQSYRAAEQRMGTYMDRPYLTPEQNQQARIRYQQQQMAKQQGYDNPSAENNFSQMTPSMRIEKEMTEAWNEASYNNAMVSEYDYYNSPKFVNDFPNYIKAKDLIKEMLEGKKALSVKDAYFLSESAYGNLQVSYEEYSKIIQDNANFIRQWLIGHGYNPKDPEAMHLGIQKFMTDTLWVNRDGLDNSSVGSFKRGHAPYNYDYIDYTSTKDRRNYFVTKTFATGTGQCHTLPVTYLVLAEVLGVEAYLSYNPEHSFVRYQNNDGTWVNFETTIGRYMLDQFYSESLPVMAEAKRNSILHSSLNKKQVIASVLVDLAVNFIQEHWLYDRKFINECMSIASNEFPNKGYINTASHYVNRRLHAAKFNNIVQEKGITDLKEIDKYPEALAAYNDFVNYMKTVTALGVQQFPEEEYMRLMEYHDQKGRLQKARNIDTKSKKNLFINF